MKNQRDNIPEKNGMRRIDRLSPHFDPQSNPIFYALTESEKGFFYNQMIELQSKEIPVESMINNSEMIERIKRLVPESLMNSLTQFRQNGNLLGAFLIQNLPIDTQLGETGESDKAHLGISEYILFSMALLMGTPYGYEGQRNGEIIQNLYPKKEDVEKQLGTGSVELDWHTEDAFHDLRSNHILLYCLRGDKNADTYVSAINPLYLESEILSALMKNEYIICSDLAHTTETSKKTCIISANHYNFYIRYDRLFTAFDTENAENAFKILTQTVVDNAFRINLKAGDLLIIDNNRAIHGRSSFTPRFDGKDRWLQRIVTRTQPVAPDNLVHGQFNVIKTNSYD